MIKMNVFARIAQDKNTHYGYGGNPVFLIVRPEVMQSIASAVERSPIHNMPLYDNMIVVVMDLDPEKGPRDFQFADDYDELMRYYTDWTRADG